jgi:hypothetical protein
MTASGARGEVGEVDDVRAADGRARRCREAAVDGEIADPIADDDVAELAVVGARGQVLADLGGRGRGSRC